MSAASYLATIERLREFPWASRRRARLGVAVACLLLALVAVAWIAAASFGRGRLESTDLRLAAEARSAQAAFATEVAHADAAAGALAASRRIQRALARGDVATIRELVRGRSSAVYRGHRLVAGSVPAGAVTRSVVVVAGAKSLGRVVGYVGVDPALLKRLAAGIALRPGDRLMLVHRAGNAASDVGVARDRTIDAKRYRSYTLELVGPPHRVLVEVATPRAAIDGAIHRRVLWAMLATVTTLATILVAGYAFVSSRRRRNAEAVAAKDMRALALVGDALASTHDPERLLPVVLHAAMQATGARAGRVMRNGDEAAREGSFAGTAQPLRLDLTSSDDHTEPTTLLLYPSGQGFNERTTALAHSLAAQASVALENARLHGIVKRQAVTDELTGLANRRAFMEALGLELRRAERFGGSLALVFADLDDFKRVNDRFGHYVGDDLLRTCARILHGRTREIDVCARLGGEEFAILLPETDMGGAESLAESLRIAISEMTVPAGDETVRVTASFGVAAYPETHTADDLMAAADRALYSAKRQGKNRVVTVGREPAAVRRGADTPAE
jgi:diguanylate cyclase (GGDEF)-like protein